MQNLNHHAAVVLPYHTDKDGKLHMVFEEKSRDFKPPYFHGGLNMLGGNWTAPDKTPRDVLMREIGEEFRDIGESPELNALLGQDFMIEKEYSPIKPHVLRYAGAGIIGGHISKGIEHVANYVCRIALPTMEHPLIHGMSVFARQLSEQEFTEIRDVLEVLGGIVTSDNIRYGGHTVHCTIDDINLENRRFSWGHERVLNDLIERYAPFANQKPGVIRSLVFTSAGRIQEPALTGDVSFEDFEKHGFQYNWASKK